MSATDRHEAKRRSIDRTAKTLHEATQKHGGETVSFSDCRERVRGAVERRARQGHE